MFISLFATNQQIPKEYWSFRQQQQQQQNVKEEPKVVSNKVR